MDISSGIQIRIGVSWFVFGNLFGCHSLKLFRVRVDRQEALKGHSARSVSVLMMQCPMPVRPTGRTEKLTLILKNHLAENPVSQEGALVFRFDAHFKL